MRQTALVTGASGGIGLELCRILAGEGFDLVLVARSEGKLKELAAQLQKAHGGSATVIAADLGTAAGPGKVADQVARRKLEIDVLVNNAGFGLNGPFAETELSRELEMIQLNITALTELSKRFLPGMIARKRGRILNVASTAAFQPGPLMAVYYATKAYVLSFSEAIALELAGSGVTVTALCPGPTHSGFQSAAKLASDAPLFRSGAVADSASVAEAGYRAMMAGERVHVTGLLNKLGTFGTRFVPRGMAATIAMKLQEVRKG